jgi:hypothetical protein
MSEANAIKSLLDSPEWKESMEEQQKWQDQFEKESEAAWNSLDQETQLKIFCAISRKIFQGELQDRGTYRHVLYDVFGFGPESYAPAQLSGYLAIHNAICDREEMADKVRKFAAENNISTEKIEKLIEHILMF